MTDDGLVPGIAVAVPPAEPVAFTTTDPGVGFFVVSTLRFRFTVFFFTAPVAADVVVVVLPFPSAFAFDEIASDVCSDTVGPVDNDFLLALAFVAAPPVAPFLFVGFALAATAAGPVGTVGTGGLGVGGGIPNNRSSSNTLSSGPRVETANLESFTLLDCSCPSLCSTSFCNVKSVTMSFRTVSYTSQTRLVGKGLGGIFNSTNT